MFASHAFRNCCRPIMSFGKYVMQQLSLSLVFTAGAFVAMSLSLCAHADERLQIPLSKAKKGCTAVIGFHDGNFSVYYEKVYVLALKPTIDRDTDQIADEYWVYYPDRDHSDDAKDEQGRPLAVTLPVKDFLENGTVVQHKTVICRCPAFFWGAGDSPAASADHH